MYFLAFWQPLNVLSMFLWQLPGSRLTLPQGTETSFCPTRTRRWAATATTTGWCLERLCSPKGFITGSSASIAMITTRTLRLVWRALTRRRTLCWGKMIKPGPCMWTTTVHGSCITTRTPTGRWFRGQALIHQWSNAFSTGSWFIDTFPQLLESTTLVDTSISGSGHHQATLRIHWFWFYATINNGLPHLLQVEPPLKVETP